MRFEAIRLALAKLLESRKTTLTAGTPEEQAEKARIDALLQNLTPNKGWRPDRDWLTALPSLLCGPIVRKVVPDEVTVWVALKSSANVTLTVFDRSPTSEKGAAVIS